MSQTQSSASSNPGGSRGSPQEHAVRFPASNNGDDDLGRPEGNTCKQANISRLIKSAKSLEASAITFAGIVHNFAQLIQYTLEPTVESTDPPTSLPDQASLPFTTSKDVGYLDPSLDRPPVGSEGEVTVFSDVNLFCEQLMRRAKMYNVRAMIPECFRGTASAWWTSLPDTRKNEFAAYTVEEWIKELKSQFGVKLDTAFNMLNGLWYSKSSLRQQRLEQFLDNVRRFTTVLGYNEEQTKLFLFGRMDSDIAGEFIQHRGLSIDNLRLMFADLYETVKSKWGQTVDNCNGTHVRLPKQIPFSTNQIAIIKDPPRFRRPHLTTSLS